MPSSTSSSRHCKDSIHLLIESCFFYNHRDDVPIDIYAVIIDNVLNGSEVYGSGRRLARAMLPISGGMCTSSTQLFSTATTTGRCSTRSAPPRPPTHLVATMPRHSSRGITPLSTRARGRTLCGSQLQQGAPDGLTSYYHTPSEKSDGPISVRRQHSRLVATSIGVSYM